ncbi:HPr family phosphocarrier protein [Paenibacillus filicis]|uniref:HPr family phosphocarrier protein n=1 Tax=Paenibacillus gyeongsangnamensis TaxID=3388067 RepID=A0ABT4QH38_9BACL|nr:HPr family phosphocarrier protein [Paenibacillus filicis]MCZ8516010.1 HPr family phosphocarrier protein [Paenibacillus filicis]
MQKPYLIRTQLGIHVRPAKQIVQTAAAFECKVLLEKNGKQYNAKSLVSVLSVGAKFGDTVTVITEGNGEAEALQAVGAILESVSEESHSS